MILPQSAAQPSASVPRATRVAPALPLPPPVVETPMELAPAAGFETDAGDAAHLEPAAPNPAPVAAP